MPDARAIRDQLVRALEADLVGPFDVDNPKAEELLVLPPLRWYLTGFLAPETARADVDAPLAARAVRALEGDVRLALLGLGAPRHSPRCLCPPARRDDSSCLREDPRLTRRRTQRATRGRGLHPAVADHSRCARRRDFGPQGRGSACLPVEIS
jgi:hypothetical protein